MPAGSTRCAVADPANYRTQFLRWRWRPLPPSGPVASPGLGSRETFACKETLLAQRRRRGRYRPEEVRGPTLPCTGVAPCASRGAACLFGVLTRVLLLVLVCAMLSCLISFGLCGVGQMLKRVGGSICDICGQAGCARHATWASLLRAPRRLPSAGAAHPRRRSEATVLCAGGPGKELFSFCHARWFLRLVRCWLCVVLCLLLCFLVLACARGLTFKSACKL